MTFLPFEKFEILSPLSNKDTAIELIKAIEPPRNFYWIWEGPTSEFIGHFRSNEFEVRRATGYKNSFLPIIRGKIEPLQDKTRLVVDLRLHYLTITLLVWIAFTGCIFSIESFKEENVKSVSYAVMVPLLIYILCMSGFWYEATKTKKILQDITKGKIVE